jgi:sterol desaturase/sphingolipid hydroxylase (fatty acid hydroxylase superfamily)
VVHHQSESYNLTTALRQTGSGFLLGWIAYLPMALLGYPAEVFAVLALITGGNFNTPYEGRDQRG